MNILLDPTCPICLVSDGLCQADNLIRTIAMLRTVPPLSPVRMMYGPGTRNTADGATPNGCFPDQKINVKDAVTSGLLNNVCAPVVIV